MRKHGGIFLVFITFWSSLALSKSSRDVECLTEIGGGQLGLSFSSKTAPKETRFGVTIENREYDKYTSILNECRIACV